MSNIAIAGDTSGTVTLQAPAIAGTTVLTLPATSGTLVTTASGQALTSPVLTNPSISSGGLTFSDSSTQTAAASPYVLKNRIINGDMRIDQRNAGASITPTAGVFTVDRWAFYPSQASKFTIQQNQNSVTPPAGFINYLGFTVASAVSIGAGDYFTLEQPIEGFNVADLDWGKSTAKTVTLSFWVRSSLTGTFGGALYNSAGTYSYAFNYTISSANTWEQKTITITGPTTGTFNTNNASSFIVTYSLGVGSTYSGTAGTWAASNLRNATGSTSVVGTSGATWYITGVQLEIGTSATPFERRLYNQELANCQRYFEKSYNQGTVIAAPTQTGMILMPNVLNFGSNSYTQAIYYKVNKRATPTVTPYAYNGTSGQWNTGVIGVNEQLGNATVDASSESKFGLVIAYTVTPNCAYGQFAASAEL